MKYTAEEVREWAAFAQAQGKLYAPMKGAHEPWEKLEAMLTAYADLLERIKADERAVPRVTERLVQVAENARVFVLNDAPKRPRIGEQELRHIAMRSALLAVWPNPPAQAAQLDGFFIHCDGVTVNVTEAYRQAGFDVLPPTVTLSALQILALAKRPANYGLFPYIGEHRAYGDNEAIILTPGMRFLAVPPATWGGAYSDPPNQQFMRGPAADKPAAEPVAQDDCHVCGCVDDGQCLCTRPHVVPVAQPADSGQVPDGWVLVPREPTAAMLDAAMTREDDEPLTDWGKIIPAPHAEIYKAMLAAAPQPGESA